MAFLAQSLPAHVLIGAVDRARHTRSALQCEGVAHHHADRDEVLRLEPLDACGLGGWAVNFHGGPPKTFGGVILVDPLPQTSWLDPGLFDWQAGRPALVAGMLAPGLANLYVLGAGTACFRSGGAELTVAMIRAQAERAHPLVDELMRVAPPRPEVPAGRGAHRLERRLHRHLNHGRASWWSAVRELEGPLAAARAS